ncbi:hypothetical protein T07_8482 [Trichinella nelsoni]|uniref:Uncharacterized protein n=1 Tax=Trichinella nelsoni TaxID=6336 RepID=A0A0V0RWP5_9BILA|nr:hypothetical protein T07_8482 [Trichinella nelsoni]
MKIFTSSTSLNTAINSTGKQRRSEIQIDGLIFAVSRTKKKQTSKLHIFNLLLSLFVLFKETFLVEFHI